MTTLTLNDLDEAWAPYASSPGYRFDEAAAERWIRDDEIKTLMRLACDLGLAIDARAAETLLGENDLGDRLIKAIAEAPERLSPASLASIEAFDRGQRLCRNIAGQVFVATGLHEAEDALLVHFTHDPRLVLTSGFCGTVDPAALSSTFMMPKSAGGLNFAFLGGSFDAENFASDGFYGSDAVLFRARHLAALNLETQDHEILFEGASVDVDAMVHLREENGTWAVLAVDGETLFHHRSLNACVAWVAENELAMASRLKGERSYDMRISDEMADAASLEMPRPALRM